MCDIQRYYGHGKTIKPLLTVRGVQDIQVRIYTDGMRLLKIITLLGALPCGSPPPLHRYCAPFPTRMSNPSECRTSSDLRQGADAPIPPVMMHGRRPEGSPAAASPPFFLETILAPQGALRRGALTRLHSKCVFHRSGVNQIGSCTFQRSLLSLVAQEG